MLGKGPDTQADETEKICPTQKTLKQIWEVLRLLLNMLCSQCGLEAATASILDGSLVNPEHRE